jgi:hypothetical protein
MVGILVFIAVTTVSEAAKSSTSIVLNPTISQNVTYITNNNTYLGGLLAGGPYMYDNTTSILWNQTHGDLRYVLRSSWSSIDSYPSACPGGQAVTGLGDSLSCSSFLSSYSESDPIWVSASGNYYTKTQSNATYVNYTGYNNVNWDTSFLYVTNGTFYLASNPSGYITSSTDTNTNTSLKEYVDYRDIQTNTSATGYCIAVDIATNTSLKNWVTAQGYLTSETDPIWSANKTLYYMITESNATYDKKTDTINCGRITGNATDLCAITASGEPAPEEDPYWTANYSTYNKANWDTSFLYVTNGTFYLATNPTGFITATIDTNTNTSLKNYVDYMDLTYNNSIAGYCIAIDTATNSSLKAYVDSADISYNTSAGGYTNAKVAAENSSMDTFVKAVNLSMDSYVDLLTDAYNTSMANYVNAVNGSAGAYTNLKVAAENTSMDTFVKAVNLSMDTYVDARDAVYNTSMDTFVKAVNVTMDTYVDLLTAAYNTSMDTYVDAYVVATNTSMANYVNGKVFADAQVDNDITIYSSAKNMTVINGNITISTGYRWCLDGTSCTKYITANSTGILIQG